MRKIAMLLAVALLPSCVNLNNKSHIKDIEAQITITSVGEDFNAFYNYFISDSIFQAERVLFPFYFTKSHIDDAGNESDITSYYEEKSNWDYIRLLNDSKTVEVSRELTIKSDSITLNFTTTVYPATIKTLFISEQGKWYLRSYVEFAGGYTW